MELKLVGNPCKRLYRVVFLEDIYGLCCLFEVPRATKGHSKKSRFLEPRRFLSLALQLDSHSLPEHNSLLLFPHPPIDLIMGAINISLEAIRSSGSLQISVTLVVLLAYPLSQAIYNIWFHPLARIPGPTIWCASRIPFVYNLLTGKLIQRQRQLHDQYGDIFRMAPDEVSFANEEAWNDIYAWRKGHKRAIRDDVFSVAPKGQADNLITTSNVKFHARVRDLMSNSFTDDALNQQSPIIEGHADMFIHQLWCAATSADHGTKGGLVNLTDWLNFFTMDVIGDLAFGESFGCLVNGEYHEWVRTLYGFLKAMSYAAAPRYWPTLQFLLEKMIPRRVMENQRRHQQYANHKINHRLDSKTQRPDFVTPFMNANPK